MEIVFSMKVPREGTTVQVVLLCPECREELEVAKNQSWLRFRCSRHGELGTLSVAEFTEGAQSAQKTLADRYGLGKPVRINFIPVEPQRVN